MLDAVSTGGPVLTVVVEKVEGRPIPSIGHPLAEMMIMMMTYIDKLFKVMSCKV